MQKRKKFFKYYIALLLLLVVLIGVLFFKDTLWKVYLPYIDTLHFSSLVDQYDGFAGMDSKEVLPLITKDDIYVTFTQQSEYLGYNYSQWVAWYPQLTLDNSSKALLYCIPVQNARSREEVFLKGFFVNESGLISAGPIDVPFPWQ